MEIDPSNVQKPDQLTCSSDDHGFLYHVRSYRCSFCRRGFSNAQALGGHMNIHRKDRARLKQVSRGPENNVSLSDSDTRKLDSLNRLASPPSEDSDSVIAEFCRNETADCSPKRASDSSSTADQKIDADPGEQLQLSLFIQAPSIKNGKEGIHNGVTGEHANSSMQSNHGESLPELDLELRL